MSIFISHYRRRTAAYEITITDADGVAVTFAAGDKVRVKIGRNGETPLLDLSSAAASANGSTLTAANPTQLYLAQGDAAATAGVYDIEASIVDSSDSKIKHAETGVFVLHDTPLGGVS